MAVDDKTKPIIYLKDFENKKIKMGSGSRTTNISSKILDIFPQNLKKEIGYSQAALSALHDAAEDYRLKIYGINKKFKDLREEHKDDPDFPIFNVENGEIFIKIDGEFRLLNEVKDNGTLQKLQNHPSYDLYYNHAKKLQETEKMENIARQQIIDFKELSLMDMLEYADFINMQQNFKNKLAEADIYLQHYNAENDKSNPIFRITRWINERKLNREKQETYLNAIDVKARKLNDQQIKDVFGDIDVSKLTINNFLSKMQELNNQKKEIISKIKSSEKINKYDIKKLRELNKHYIIAQNGYLSMIRREKIKEIYKLIKSLPHEYNNEAKIFTITINDKTIEVKNDEAALANFEKNYYKELNNDKIEQENENNIESSIKQQTIDAKENQNFDDYLARETAINENDDLSLEEKKEARDQLWKEFDDFVENDKTEEIPPEAVAGTEEDAKEVLPKKIIERITNFFEEHPKAKIVAGITAAVGVVAIGAFIASQMGGDASSITNTNPDSAHSLISHVNDMLDATKQKLDIASQVASPDLTASADMSTLTTPDSSGLHQIGDVVNMDGGEIYTDTYNAVDGTNGLSPYNGEETVVGYNYHGQWFDHMPEGVDPSEVSEVYGDSSVIGTNLEEAAQNGQIDGFGRGGRSL